jgi:hypothetical protein
MVKRLNVSKEMMLKFCRGNKMTIELGLLDEESAIKAIQQDCEYRRQFLFKENLNIIAKDIAPLRSALLGLAIRRKFMR